MMVPVFLLPMRSVQVVHLLIQVDLAEVVTTLVDNVKEELKTNVFPAMVAIYFISTHVLTSVLQLLSKSMVSVIIVLMLVKNAVVERNVILVKKAMYCRQIKLVSPHVRKVNMATQAAVNLVILLVNRVLVLIPINALYVKMIYYLLKGNVKRIVQPGILQIRTK